MASNNSKTNKFVPVGGGGWRKHPQTQSRKSAKSVPKLGSNTADVLDYLTELFGQVLDEEIIYTIGENCKWNVESCVEALVEVSEDSSTAVSNRSPNSLRVAPSTQAQSMSPSKKSARYKAPKPAHTCTVSAVTSALAAIKVAYEGYDDDLDDADIIFEEEDEGEEFEVIMNGGERPPPTTNERSCNWQGSVSAVEPDNNFREMKKVRKPCPIVSAIGDYISSGNKILVLLRGCPGSGKSYLGRDLIAKFIGPDCDPYLYIFSTDSYFSRSGTYDFKPEELPAAHDWNQNCVMLQMRQGLSPVIVDNTNTMLWEMKPYAKLAVQYGYAIYMLEPTTPWRWKESELFRRNSHGVTRASIRNMLDRYDSSLTTAMKL